MNQLRPVRSLRNPWWVMPVAMLGMVNGVVVFPILLLMSYQLEQYPHPYAILAAKFASGTGLCLFFLWCLLWPEAGSRH